MSTDTKQWVMTMAQKRMLAAAASKEAMMGYLQNAQVLAVDAYKEFRTTGIKDFTQKYVGLLSHHSQTAVLSLKQLAIKQAQQAGKRGKVKRCCLIGRILKKCFIYFCAAFRWYVYPWETHIISLEKCSMQIPRPELPPWRWLAQCKMQQRHVSWRCKLVWCRPMRSATQRPWMW